MRPAKGQQHLSAEMIGLMKLVETRRYGDIEDAARQVLARKPGQALATKVLSFAQVATGQYKTALPLLEALAKSQPHDPEIHNNLGIALCALLRREESVASFKRALAITPKDPEILKNLGAAYADETRWNEAVPWLLKAIEHHPGDYVEAVSLLAACLMNADRVDEALACYRELWSADANYVLALYQLLAGSLRVCDWRHLDAWIKLLRECSDGFSRPLHSPFPAFAVREYGGREHRLIAEAHARNVVSPYIYRAGAEWRRSEPPADRQRLRIGYLSADYRYHAVGFVIPELIERHDRSRFEVHGYSLGEDDGSETRARLVRAFEHFADLHDKGIPYMLERIRQDDIDILVDLNGWTTDGRPELLALRCARTHVNWLGYAGTMGHPQLADYIIGDPVATPLEHAEFYTEVIAQMPHCYLPADTTRQPGAVPTRASQGLPDDGFIFCSFNNNYKFNPALFDLWARLLREVPGSVLWISRPRPTAVDNLKLELERRGVAAERLVFATRVDSAADHMARIQLADLALDTFPYNSHSSGVDTLWAGVPMVTLLGDTFAARVGASLLKAVGLDELVAPDAEAYCAMALDLARHPEKLAALRRRLAANRASSPLFDMAAFTASLEGILLRIHDNTMRGVKEALPAQPG